MAVSGHDEDPAADSGRARAEEHRWGVRKLVAGSVWEEKGRRGRLHGAGLAASGGFAGKLSSRPRRPWRRWRRMRGRRKAACGGEGRPGPATVAAHARRAQHARAASWRIWARLCSACLCVRGWFGRRRGIHRENIRTHKQCTISTNDHVKLPINPNLR